MSINITPQSINENIDTSMSLAQEINDSGEILQAKNEIKGSCFNRIWSWIVDI